MKTCTMCGKEKSIGNFNKKPGAPDGRYDLCKTCTRDFRRAERERKQAELEKVRCLHGACMRPGKDQPEGLGFRFCDIHVHHARKILDNPTRAWSPAGYALPTKGSA